MSRNLSLLCLALVLLVDQALAAPQARIVGGKEVDIASHPYLVSIRFRRGAGNPYYHECGGSIYSEKVIITAAQCFRKMDENVQILVVAGANTRTGVDGRAYPASKWILHERYNSITVDYDVALIMLDDPLKMNGFDISKISIRPKEPAADRVATVAGWGYRQEFGPSSHILEEAHVPIVSRKECQASYDMTSITERMICAGYISSGGVDACQGDTGGPLVIDNQLVGLVSWGRGCARPGYPAVYTFVGSLKQWIDNTIAANL